MSLNVSRFFATLTNWSICVLYRRFSIFEQSEYNQVYNLRVIAYFPSRQLKISKLSKTFLVFYEISVGKMTSKISQ